MTLYDGYGNIISAESGGGSVVVEKPREIMRSISHRGYNTVAPENTIPAYVLSRKMGYKYAECDVAFTSDGVAVLLHDATIDRTSDGSGNIYDLTYAEVSQYDFGSWKSTDYAGTKIPTFEEFIIACKELGLHPYIELKSDGNYTEAQIASIVAMVKSAGMRGNVTYVSFQPTYLQYVKNTDPSANLGLCAFDISSDNVSQINALKTDENLVFVAVRYTSITDDKVAICKAYDLPLEAWCPNDASWIEGMNPYITGVTSDSLIAEDVLLKKHISE